MEQRDYILREIERFGVIINALRQKIFGGNGNLAITLEQQIENTKGMLLNEINFDLDKFLDLNIDDLDEYISGFGFSVENIEILAEYLSQIGFSDNCESSKKYLYKALQLYELCTSKSKTYSLDREINIKTIRNFL
jgi:site-specific DNA-adenine methylase